MRRTVGLRNRRHIVQASTIELSHGYAQQPRRACYRYCSWSMCMLFAGMYFCMQRSVSANKLLQ